MSTASPDVGPVSRNQVTGRPVTWFRDDLLRPFLVVAVLSVSIAQLVIGPTRSLTIGLFVPDAILTVATLFPLRRLAQWQWMALSATGLGLAAMMFPLAPTAAKVLPFLASALVGEKVATRGSAITIAAAGAVVCAVAVWVSGSLDPAATTEWPWWLCLSVAAPVYVGIARRDQQAALASAEHAAAEAERARRSEAREAALIERSRIAHEIHDVLGHSLSAIALQLASADSLHVNGRDDDANKAVRRARALAVSSITETRRAVHALREDTLPLPDTLRLMADDEHVGFEIVGEPGPVPVESAQAVVRVAQEALTNATKHAPGADRDMTLAYRRGRLFLRVHNGRPHVRVDHVAGAGMGLVGMRERAALLGGALRAAPDGHGGWTVELDVPRTTDQNGDHDRAKH